MRIRSAIVLSVAIVLAGESAPLAKDVALPNLDLQKLCQARQSSVMSEVGSASNNFIDLCVESEQRAREQLSKDWANFPVADKAQCVQPTVYAPNYIEWITCLEMTRDVRKISASTASSNKIGDQTVPGRTISRQWLDRQYCRLLAPLDSRRMKWG